MEHKAGFVSIIGSPNVGKSTLMNQLMNEKLSIITSKAQTTRHRIRGILNEPDYQIVFSDTPGVVNASYELHNTMMKFVSSSLIDADVLLFITDPFEDKMNHKGTFERIKSLKVPIICLINKIDLKSQEQVLDRITYWKEMLPQATILPISALHKFNVQPVLDIILEHLPASPPFFEKDAITDRPMRFFIAEIIREKIFLNLKKEVPYACQVEVTEYIDKGKVVAIRANIIVERDSQKGIVIGNKGQQLKYIGMDSRKEIEKFIGKRVFLETFVKVDKDWRNNDNKLKKYGYKS